LTSRSISEVPICWVSAWLMNRWFAQVTSESKATTLIPGLGLLERRAKGRGVVAGDDDPGGVRLDRRLDRRDLRRSGVGGAAADHDLAAELL